MQNNYFRFYKPKALTLLILIVGISIHFANQFISEHYEMTLPILGIVTTLLILIDRTLWEYPPFKWLFWIPNMGGRYEGRIKYTHPISQKKESKRCALEVSQTGSKVKVKCFFKRFGNEEKTTSDSIVENIVKNENDSYTLVFTYQNEGNQQGFQPHKGTNVLNLIENRQGKSFKGIYYTNREPQTKGDIEVHFTSKTLKNDY